MIKVLTNWFGQIRPRDYDIVETFTDANCEDDGVDQKFML